MVLGKKTKEGYTYGMFSPYLLKYLQQRLCRWFNYDYVLQDRLTGHLSFISPRLGVNLQITALRLC